MTKTKNKKQPEKMMNVLIAPGVGMTKVKPANGKKFTLKELQKMVGGYIEMVPNATGEFCYVWNDSGLLLGLEFNPDANFHFFLKSGYYRDLGLVGNVAIVEKKYC
ncbi:DUF3846 domain-containing protein [Pontibacter virosus]|nr:DUF3846 domain-containing protein [Pontibacter virosus]